jgi:hypothetical protein
VNEVMADGKDAEGTVTGEDQARKHGDSSNRNALVMTAREEEQDHATVTEASMDVSAILPFALGQCSSRSCKFKLGLWD